MKFPPVQEILEPASAAVTFDGAAPALLTFVVQLGYLHFLLFGTPLGITAGQSPEHCHYQGHEMGRALDLRFGDKSEAEQNLFLAIIAYAAPHQNCAVCDETLNPGSCFVHLEYRGV